MADLLSSILPDWPSWAVKLLFVMTAALTCTLLANFFYTPDDEKETEEEQILLKSKHKTHQSLHTEFDAFRRSYLSVYLVIMLADWMQGTHMYTLYLSYNVNISALFLTGFLTGAIFAPFLGSLVDKFGRKRSCIVYCLLEIMINWIEHYNDFRTLLLGRILGGISTNLLFSAFESWMATEHRKRGFPEEWMARTYSEVCVFDSVLPQVVEIELFTAHYLSLK
jgi:predicted MFS family arabinose efflux permease